MPVTGKHPGALRAVQTRAAQRALTVAAIKVSNEAKKLAPVDTGSLRRAITFSVTGSSPVDMVARVGSNVEHAIYVSLGTKPHEIRPKKQGGVLRFPSGGKAVFTRLVHHPGTKANDYLVRALQALRR